MPVHPSDVSFQNLSTYARDLKAQQFGSVDWLSNDSSSMALLSSFWTAPTLTLVLALICRVDRPPTSRNRKISLIFRIVVLGVAIASSQKAKEGSK